MLIPYYLIYQRFVVLISCLIVLNSCTTNKNIDIAEYPIVPTISELSKIYDIKIDKSNTLEHTEITKYFDGSTELDYTYDALDTKFLDELYYSVTVEKHRTISDAKQSFGVNKGALSLVGNSFSQGTIEIDSLDLPGDQSYYAFRTYNEEPNGMFFICRKKTIIYSMIISGIYTPDHSLVLDLIIPKIENLENFNFK